MRILSYNILSGGFHNYDHNATHPERLNLITQVIKEVNPDIASLVDTFRWDELYTNEELAQLFGYKYAYCINLGDERLKKLGHNNGITVLSNIADTTFEILDLKTRTALNTKIKLNNRSCDLFSLYLDDLEEDIRVSQVNELAKSFNENAPTLIMGDLNTFSPDDANDTVDTINEFLKENPKYEGLRVQLDDMARSEVIKLFRNFGFQDASVNHEPTFPTSQRNISNKPLIRVDYCLYKSLSIKSFEILKGDIFEKASDHYPVLVEI